VSALIFGLGSAYEDLPIISPDDFVQYSI